MFFKILMVLGALYAFIYTFMKVKSVFARALTLSSAITVGLMSMSVYLLSLDAYYFYALILTGALVYAFSNTDFSRLKIITLAGNALLTAIPLVLLLFMQDQIYEDGPYQVFMLIYFFTGLIQIVVLAYGLIHGVQELQEELGFLVIQGIDALVRVIGGMMFFIWG